MIKQIKNLQSLLTRLQYRHEEATRFAAAAENTHGVSADAALAFAHEELLINKVVTAANKLRENYHAPID